MSDHIPVPFDGSPLSERALTHAVEHFPAGTHDAELEPVAETVTRRASIPVTIVR